MPKRQCLCCGMTAFISLPDFDSGRLSQHCSKCDDDLLAQTDMSILEEDIAHNHETIPAALQKLDTLLNEAYAGYYQKIYLVVGGGLIKEEILKQLHYYELKNYILSYEMDRRNHGAIVVKIRESN